MTAPTTSPFMRYGPAVTLLLLLGVLALGIHRKSSVATVPPFFDSLSYYTKSKHVWEQLHQKVSLRRTLNVEPVVRPPGCAIISYPFGFSNDYRGFYFRNTFVPIAFWVLALGLMAHHLVLPGASRWTAASIIGGFASFSMFYHFDYHPSLDATWGFCHTWGMQDCVLAAIGALAMALIFLSVRKQSVPLAFAGSIFGAWALLIKPSGMLIMALVFWTWFIESVIRHWPLTSAWRSDRAFRRYTIVSGILLVAIFSWVFITCIRSKYLSPENWKYMSGAVQILYSSLSSTFSAQVLDSWIAPTLGWHWFALLALAVVSLCIVWFSRVTRRKWEIEDCRLPAALIGFAAALYWWFFMAGLQVRYLFPFILIFLTGIFPDLLRLVAKLGRTPRILVAAVSLMPVFFVSAALFAKDCPRPWQHALGISVNVGGYDDEVRIGDALVAEARARQTAAIVYSLESGVSAGIIHGVGELANLADPTKAGVHWYFAFDWTRGSLIRRTDLLNSGYIFFRPMPDAKELLGVRDATDWRKEAAVTSAWLGGLDESAGVQTVVRNSLCLLRIVDRQKLNTAFDQFMTAHQWRELFTSENALSPLSSYPQQFAASSETLFHASPSNSAAALRSNASLSIALEPQRILLRISGADPVLQLPDFEVPPQRNIILRLMIKSPLPNHIEIRRDSEMDQPATATAPISQEMAVGDNELYIRLSCEPGRLRLTLHPAPWVESIVLHEIEVRAVPQ